MQHSGYGVTSGRACHTSGLISLYFMGGRYHLFTSRCIPLLCSEYSRCGRVFISAGRQPAWDHRDGRLGPGTPTLRSAGWALGYAGWALGGAGSRLGGRGERLGGTGSRLGGRRDHLGALLDRPPGRPGRGAGALSWPPSRAFPQVGAPWNRDSRVHRFEWTWVPRYLGTLVPWFPGSRVPGFPGVPTGWSGRRAA